MLRNPVEILGNIGGIDNQQKAVSGQAAHGQIIEQPSGLIAQSAVLQLVGLQRADVIQRQVLDCGLSPRTAYLDFTHVADVEESSVRPHRLMLLNDATIGDGHLPATKLDQACSELAVYGVEGSPFALSICCHGVVSYCSETFAGAFTEL